MKMIPRPAREVFADLIERGMTGPQLEAHFGCCQNVIDKWKREFGLRGITKGGARKRSLPVDQIRSMVAAGMARQAMADQLGCGMDLLDRVMRDEGIQTRRQAVRTVKVKRQHIRYARPTERAYSMANPFGI